MSSEALPFIQVLARALRERGPDAQDPRALQDLTRELFKAFLPWAKGSVPLSLVCLGPSLRTRLDGAVLTDATSALVARALFDRGVVLLKVSPTLGLGALTKLGAALASAPSALKAAGGLAARVKDERSVVEVVELDLEAITLDHQQPPAHPDPLVQAAIAAMLQHHEDRQKAAAALARLPSLAVSADALGVLLDELLAAAGPGLVAAPRPLAHEPGLGLGRLTLEELGQLTSAAFEAARARQPAEPAPVAQALALALGRLTPDARLGVLGALSAQGELLVGQALDDELLLQTFAPLLGDGGPMLDLIGQRLRRLRPDPEPRKRLLVGLDAQAAGHGGRLEGVAFQQLQAAALGPEGQLDLPLRAALPALAALTRTRRDAGTEPSALAALMRIGGPEPLLRRAVQLFLRELAPDRPLTPGEVTGLGALVEQIELNASPGDALPLLSQLAGRVVAQPSAPAAALLEQLLAGPGGALRLALLIEGKVQGGLPLAKRMLQAVEEGPAAARERLRQAFLASTDEALRKDAQGMLTEAGPFGVELLVEQALTDPRKGLVFAKAALRHRSARAKEAVVRAMGRLAPQGAVGLLGPMTGLGDDAACRSALQLDPAAPEVSLRYLQTVAIEALGASKLPDAVPVLNQLLLRTALFGSPQFHEQRPAVAQALAAHGSPAAKAALEAGRAHKNRSIRDACTAVAS